MAMLFVALLLIGIYTVWWWIDSARTCDTQDEYNLRGICLMRIQERAKQGDNAAQGVTAPSAETSWNLVSIVRHAPRAHPPVEPMISSRTRPLPSRRVAMPGTSMSRGWMDCHAEE
ncbi:hypothetical protein C8239_01840 [Paracidovorax avenae]|nr:hypothetical protein C8239_01840 [Paracidovorax avenae]AVS87077.1 hypothetical protein C8238_01385 [Paracidovorax avenae]AVS94907.1 hypothetical protein C8232_00465 [Paracidovorax avenae]AVT01249.1 hypothetical protein C8243_01215 [Paracidovorax avenae]AVT08323.1 hypothetical protein C8242_01580 [Paracidovorax avenae]